MRSLLILLVHALTTLEINLIPVERRVIATLGAASGNILTKYTDRPPRYLRGSPPPRSFQIVLGLLISPIAHIDFVPKRPSVA